MGKNNEILEEIFCFFGGEAKISSDFPAMAQAYKNTQKKSLLTQKAAASDLDTGNAAIGMSIVSIGLEKEKAETIEILLKLTNENIEKYNVLIIKAIKISTQEIIAEKAVAQFFGNHATALLEVPKSYYKDCVLKLNTLEVSNSFRTAELAIPLSNYIIDLKPEFIINHPDVTEEHKTAKATKINVFYGSSKPSYADYFFSYQDNTNDRLLLPTKGSVKIGEESNYTFEKIENVSLSLATSLDNEVFHENVNTVSISANELSWEFNDFWGGKKLSKLGRPYGKAVIYTLAFQVKIKDLDPGKCTIVISNRTDLSAYNTKGILPIYYYVDCLAQGTNIKMADGTSKRIEQIKIGETIHTGTGNASAKVMEVTKGSDAGNLLRVTTESGHEIKTSFNHPFKTDKGFVAANELVSGSKVIMDSGKKEIIANVCFVEIEYRDVYNLILEGDVKTMVANGFIVGDLNIQNDTILYNEEVRNKIPKDLLKDYDSFQERM